MTDVVTYQAHITHGFKAPPWLAYIVLPDGSLWGVRFEGATEEAVRANAIALYEKEKAKWHTSDNKTETVTHEHTNARGQHLVGTVCMINHGLKQRMRCKAAEVPKFEEKGWIKGGPRTPFRE